MWVWSVWPRPMKSMVLSGLPAPFLFFLSETPYFLQVHLINGSMWIWGQRQSWEAWLP